MAIVKVRKSELRERTKGQRESCSEAPPSNEWDSVCSFCDDGGDLVCCDGGCLRSFHPTKEHGKDSKCTTLDLTQERWQTLRPKGLRAKTVDYVCDNCTYRQHQCFACGMLGSSDSSSKPEVFQCKDENCGHYYHPKCVAELLYHDMETCKAIRFALHVSCGLKEFRCPMHRCTLCKEAEKVDDKQMQFALCRRCPTAYHRKCLPREISFKANEKKGIPKRAWGNIFADRILIYCMKHDIEPKLRTPKRDHIVFPDARDLPSSKRHRNGPSKEQDDKLDNSLPNPSESSPQHAAESIQKSIDSFAPAHLFPHPQPGSCGWLDE